MSDEYRNRRDIDELFDAVYDTESGLVKFVPFKNDSELRTIYTETDGSGNPTNRGTIDAIIDNWNLKNKADITHTHTSSNITDLKDNIVDIIYPVGAIYMSVNSTDPSILFGGSWLRLKDTFLLASGDIYDADPTTRTIDDEEVDVDSALHGEAEHTLTSAESGQKNLGTVTSTGGNHSHPLGSNIQYLGAVNTGSGVSRNDNAGNSGTKINDLLQAPDGVFRYNAPNSGNLSVSTNINGSDATESHNNMPPYLAVFMWRRIE